MGRANLCRALITGNLTKDPELRSLPSGASVCNLRVAVNTRRKDSSSGEWVDKPNFFDVTVWGGQGANCATYLAKGRPVAVDGRLDWREYEDNGGNKREAVSIVAERVQFLGGRPEGEASGDAPATAEAAAAPQDPPESEVRFDPNELQPIAVGVGDDDDIPF